MVFLCLVYLYHIPLSASQMKVLGFRVDALRHLERILLSWHLLTLVVLLGTLFSALTDSIAKFENLGSGLQSLPLSSEYPWESIAYLCAFNSCQTRLWHLAAFNSIGFWRHWLFYSRNYRLDNWSNKKNPDTIIFFWKHTDRNGIIWNKRKGSGDGGVPRCPSVPNGSLQPPWNTYWIPVNACRPSSFPHVIFPSLYRKPIPVCTSWSVRPDTLPRGSCSIQCHFCYLNL